MCSVCSSYLSPALVLSISFLVFPMALFRVTRLISPSPCKISVSHAVSCVSQLTISYSVLCRSLSCFKNTFSLSLFPPRCLSIGPIHIFVLSRNAFEWTKEPLFLALKSSKVSISSLKLIEMKHHDTIIPHAVYNLSKLGPEKGYVK